MHHLIHPTYKLILSAYACKKGIKKCLKHDVKSPSYRLAQYYQDNFSVLEKSPSLTPDVIQTIMCQIKVQLFENRNCYEAQELLSNILSFIENLKPFIDEGAA